MYWIFNRPTLCVVFNTLLIGSYLSGKERLENQVEKK